MTESQTVFASLRRIIPLKQVHSGRSNSTWQSETPIGPITFIAVRLLAPAGGPAAAAPYARDLAAKLGHRAVVAVTVFEWAQAGEHTSLELHCAGALAGRPAISTAANCQSEPGTDAFRFDSPSSYQVAETQFGLIRSANK